MKDLTGQRFERLLAVERQPVFSKKTKYLCQCSCGNTVVVLASDLNRKDDRRTRSCGCLHKERTSKARKTHGLSRTDSVRNRFYDIWTGIMDRCYTTHSSHYKDYGARGITVCKSWHNPTVFVKWCELQNPNPKLTVERMNNNGPYSPRNCKFATRKEQSRNTRATVRIEYNGEVLCRTEFAEKYAIVSRDCIKSRMKRGWTLEQAAFTPISGSRYGQYSSGPRGEK